MLAAEPSKVASICAALGAASATLGGGPAADLDTCNVIWTSPSKSSAGSMPIGNGEVGLNLWVEEGGDLLFYVSRTDSFSEACRLLKLGRVRVRLNPNPFRKGLPFRQELKLRQGRIEIEASGVRLWVAVHPKIPVIYVSCTSANPIEVLVSGESWRSERRRLQGEELKSSWTMQIAPMEVWESGDRFRSDERAVAWFHRNESSVVPLTLKHQGIAELASLAEDPLRDRTFGIRMQAQGLARVGEAELASKGRIRRFEVRAAAFCSQPDSEEAWLGQVRAILDRAPSAAIAKRDLEKWWGAFWDRSWIFVDGDGDARRVTEAYVLQRWVTACGARGEYPIKFNGSIFTVEPAHTGGPAHDADWRRWGDCYWWQNTRLPVAPMPACGDYEMMDSLFRLYERNLALCKARAKLYYAAGGVYFPETMTIFGTYANQDYGWDRTGRSPSEVLCPWWQWTWQQGLELLSLMLDRYDHTEDRRFLSERLLPMATEVLLYYDTRFARDSNGKLRITPTQAAETYWFEVVNDAPSIAGLTSVTQRMLAIPSLPEAARKLSLKIQAATPRIPIRRLPGGGAVVAPAEAYKDQRNNVENPELYALWPFRVFGVGGPNLRLAQNTFLNRIERANTGWQYDGQCAAIAGLAQEAKASLVAKVRNSNPAHRFPAMWGPNYDWLPDQCHGGNIMLTLQYMVLQSAPDSAGLGNSGIRSGRHKLYVLPAWPKEWNVRFRLRGPGRSVVEGEFRDGSTVRLVVSP